MTCIRCHREFEPDTEDDLRIVANEDEAAGVWCPECTFEYRLYENIRR